MKISAFPAFLRDSGWRMAIHGASSHPRCSLWRHWASGKHCMVTENSYFSGLLT